MSELERWERRFDVEEYVFGTEPNAFLARQAALLRPGMRALTIADGEGRNGVWLAQQGLDVTWQDFSPRAEEKARALAGARGVEMRYLRADIRSLDWPEGEYDLVVGIFFQFLDPSERAEVFAGIRRAVREGGVVLMEGYGPKQLDYGTGGPKRRENLYTPELLREAFAGFSEVRVKAYEAEIGEGAGHRGMSALVDMVARR